MLHTMLEQQQRVRHGLLEWNLGANKKVVQPVLKAKGNDKNLSLWLNEVDLDTKSDGLKTVNKVLTDSSDLLGAPSRFLNSIQQYWVTSLILITIILVTILLLCCFVHCYCCGTRKLLTKTTNIKKSLANRLLSSSLLRENGTDEV